VRRGALPAACALLAAASSARAWAPASPTPTPRPTAHARLSGGFGRPRATVTPADPASGGQSLADVVRAAHDGRAVEKSAGVEKGGVVIDNRSLITDPKKGRVSTSRVVVTHAPSPGRPAPAAPAAATTPGPGATPAAAGGEPGAPGMPTEAEWRGIADGVRKRVADGKAKVAELEATTKKLENDFYAWDDGQYRDRVIKPSWDHARQQLDDAKAELAAAEKELADLPERARRAGALPGWIRQ
jgi:hypothetical protein